MTGKTSNNQEKKSAKRRQAQRAAAKKQQQEKNAVYQQFIKSASISSPVVPNNRPYWIQLKDTKKELMTLCGKEKHLEPILHVLEGLPQKKESNYAPTPIDRSRFAKVYELLVSDGTGGHIQDADVNNIMQQHEAVFDLSLKHTLKADYSNDLKNGKTEWKNQQSAANAFIPILEACFHERI